MDQLHLSEADKGQVIKVVAGEPGRQFVYEFEVLEPGKRPQCLITQTGPDGRKTDASLVYLEGTGRWTNRQQNPVQTQERAFTIGWGMLNAGGLLSVIAVDSEEGPFKRYVFNEPAVSDIALED